jgi:hypothetical protein
MTKNCGRCARWNVKYHSIVSSLNIRHRSSGVHDLGSSVSCLSLNQKNDNYCDVDACNFQALKSLSEKARLHSTQLAARICCSEISLTNPRCNFLSFYVGIRSHSLSPGSCIGLRCYNRLVVSVYDWVQATAGIRDFNLHLSRSDCMLIVTPLVLTFRRNTLRKEQGSMFRLQVVTYRMTVCVIITMESGRGANNPTP